MAAYGNTEKFGEFVLAEHELFKRLYRAAQGILEALAVFFGNMEANWLVAIAQEQEEKMVVAHPFNVALGHAPFFSAGKIQFNTPPG